MKRFIAARSTLVLLAFGCTAAQAAPVAYVASDGNDNRGGGRCTITAPCRTFQAAHDVVDARGQVVALDSADFGPVTIGKSVSIVGSPGAAAGITVAAGNGITIATAGVDVVVRNVQIVGAGGARGIDLSAGRSLTLENVVVAGMANDGVHVSNAESLAIVDSVLRGNGRHGAFVDRGNTNLVRSQLMGNGGSGFSLEAGTFGALASVVDSVASGNGESGFSSRSLENSSRMIVVRSTASRNVGAGFGNARESQFADAKMNISASVSTLNGKGLYSRQIVPDVQSSMIYSAGNNMVQFNGVDVDGFVTVLAGQ